jgi:hypothetical protein
MRTIRFALPATLALALAACAQSPSTTVSEDLSSAFGPDDLALRTSQNPVPVVVHGRVAGLDHKTLVQTVTNDMQGSTWGPDPHFVPTSSRMASSGNNEYSIIMMVNGPQTITAAQLCAAPAARAGAAPASAVGDVSLIGALCRYDQAITGVSARTANIQSANDPAFHRLIASTANDLTSPRMIGTPQSLDTDD